MNFEKQEMNMLFENDDSEEENGVDWYNVEELDSFDEELVKTSSESVFAFETDHAALRGNTDYQELIKTLALLEVQRIKTVEDIERLEQLRHNVRNNPWEYVDKLLKGDTSDIPSRIQVVEVPKIDWSKYSRKCNDEGPSTSTKQNIVPKQAESSIKQETKTNNNVEDDSSAVTVRGRVFDQSKPQTFNQLWTAEEQLRLEELLLEYPSEKNENNRWRKIAQALGNRTTKQVCSRVQKYFKKLTKAGLPIPGHQLKSSNMTSLKKRPRKQTKRVTRGSTFFPIQHLGAPQLLDDCEDDESKPRILPLTNDLKIDIIEKVIEYKKKDAQLSPFSQPGIKCGVCGEMPVQGTRWHCLVCQSTDLCSDCVIEQLNADHLHPLHPPTHPLEPVTNPTVAHLDPDYTPDSFKSTNYLDPNFVTSNGL